MSPQNSCLNNIPQEILEHIAFFTATERFLGPPTQIIPLLLTNRRIYLYLSISSNPHLYARIFVHKFDVVPAIHRLDPGHTSSTIISSELRRRCGFLRRMRLRLDSRVIPALGDNVDDRTIKEILWMSYLMMLENNGKNEQQLRHYAQMEEWLKEYWFDPQGSSLAVLCTKGDMWLPNSELNSLAMWLFWFFLNPNSYVQNTPALRDAIGILKILALGAHQYDLCSPSWLEFLPEARSGICESPVAYLGGRRLAPPPLAPPAILSFLVLANRQAENTGRSNPRPSSCAFAVESHNWENEWERCLSLGRTTFEKSLTGAFTPGSIQGVWEGMFTYTEFTLYAALLSGAPPSILQRCLVAQHRQTWKLREYHFSISKSVTLSSGITTDLPAVGPLSAGDPLNAYFPVKTTIFERPDGIELHEPGRADVIFYEKATCYDAFTADKNGDTNIKPSVQDVIILGEGHSAWGQFNLIGRIRPCDGFICLSKEYVGGDRGKWLYRGYLVGNMNGNLTGRWRDTMSPADMAGYEGCFAMGRRR